MKLATIKLDDTNFPANGGEVVALPDTVAAYLASTTDRDGARDPRMRLWWILSHIPLGARVQLRNALETQKDS